MSWPAPAAGWCSLRPKALSEPVPPVNVTQSLAEWLLVLAAILLPLDVALRRLVIGREGLVPMGTGPARVGQRRQS